MSRLHDAGSDASLAKIIIVDDKKENLLAFDVALRSLNCERVKCSSAKEALPYLDDENVAVYLLDVQMPEMDGLQLAARIRLSAAQKRTPILFISAVDHGHHSTSAYELGAVDFMYKPADPLILRTKVEFFLDMFNTRRELERKTVQLEQSAESERTFILEHALDAVVATDENNLVAFWNGHAERLFGWSKSEIIGKDMTELIVPARFIERHRAGVRRFIDTGVAKIQNRRIEIPGLRKDGKEFLMELTVSSVRTPAGGLRFYSFMRDISALKETQGRIAESESTLNQIFSESPSFMSFVRGPDFVFERVNDEYLKLVSRRDILGKRVVDVFPEVEAQGFIKLLKQVYETKKPFVGSEVPLILENTDEGRKEIFVDFVYQALTHPDGEAFGIAVQGYDVTEKVMSRRRIEESERQLRAFAESIPPMAFVADDLGNIIYFNQRFYSYTGIPVGEGKGWEWQNYKFIHPEDEIEAYQTWKEALQTAEAFEMEFRLRRHDSEYRWHLSRATPSKDVNGKVQHWYGTNTDIHDQKVAGQRAAFLARASHALNSSLNVNQILNELAKVAVPEVADWCSIRMKDPNGQLEQVAVAHSDPKKVKWAWELQKKFPPDENATSGPFQVIRTGKSELMPDISDEMLVRASTTEEKKVLVRSLGFRSYVCVPIKSREKIVGTLTLVTADESGRRYSADDLLLAEELGARAGSAVENARLYVDSQNINKLKDEFLANLSHELRTPMNVIQGYADILESEAEKMSPKELMDSVRAISRNAKAQAAIIGDLLDVSSIITGKFSYKPSEVCPASVVKEILGSLEHTADAKGIKVIFDGSGSTEYVLADPTRLHQIVWNLLSNAIKFTGRGGTVRVKVSREVDQWCFIVTDTGKGIDPEFLPYVFDRFRQEDASTTRRYGGLGLGLSIVRHLVELHGGQVRAESAGIGQGAKFIVTLPLKSSNRPVVQAEAKASGHQPKAKSKGSVHLKNVNILLVDDSIDNRELIRRLLAKAGATVIDADGASEAREKLKTFNPDVIVSDIGMPEENGLEFIQKLRASGRESVKNVPAIALTAYVREEEKDAAFTAGFQAHVGKPFSASILLETIHSLVGNVSLSSAVQ